MIEVTKVASDDGGVTLDFHNPSRRSGRMVHLDDDQYTALVDTIYEQGDVPDLLNEAELDELAVDLPPWPETTPNLRQECKTVLGQLVRLVRVLEAEVT